MIINPVMMRNTLNARGDHAAIVSVMMACLPVLQFHVSSCGADEKHAAHKKICDGCETAVEQFRRQGVSRESGCCVPHGTIAMNRARIAAKRIGSRKIQKPV